jgi:hypothetical protein
MYSCANKNFDFVMQFVILSYYSLVFFSVTKVTSNAAPCYTMGEVNRHCQHLRLVASTFEDDICVGLLSKL